MGFCIDCEKCKRMYDTAYFPEFCPYCYSEVDKVKADLDLAIEALKNIQCDKVNGHTDECRIATRTIAKLQERK